MLLHVLKVVGLCLEVLVIFNLIIIVHELGHFLAARWRGLYVEEFGVWFGTVSYTHLTLPTNREV